MTLNFNIVRYKGCRDNNTHLEAGGFNNLILEEL